MLSTSFFERDTVEVARDLLGCVLVHETDEGRISGRIVETEAYRGMEDKACHAHIGRTSRTEGLFADPGMSYIYLCYGVHWLINVVAKLPDREDYPGAVLVRAVEPLEGQAVMAENRTGRKEREWTDGPGKLTQAMGIDGTYHATDLTTPSNPIYFEAGDLTSDEAIAEGPRIGINPPEPWKSVPWRFWIEGNRYVSR